MHCAVTSTIAVGCIWLAWRPTYLFENRIGNRIFAVSQIMEWSARWHLSTVCRFRFFIGSLKPLNFNSPILRRSFWIDLLFLSSALTVAVNIFTQTTWKNCTHVCIYNFWARTSWPTIKFRHVSIKNTFINPLAKQIGRPGESLRLFFWTCRLPKTFIQKYEQKILQIKNSQHTS